MDLRQLENLKRILTNNFCTNTFKSPQHPPLLNYGKPKIISIFYARVWLEYSLEELMLKLRLQYFGHLMQRIDLLKKTLMLGKIEDRRRRGWQRMTCLDGITNSVDMSLSIFQEIVKAREACHGVKKSQTQLNDWTTMAR